MAARKKTSTNVVPVRMPPALVEKITSAAERSGLAQADVIRLCLSIGYEDLRRVDFDLGRVVSDAARGRYTVVERDPPMAADEGNGTE